jgi:DnaJ-class molecular chaperone
VKSAYEILEVCDTATATELKSAYRRLAMAYHPDRNGGDKAKEKLFRQVQEAYEILSDPGKRALYDLKQRDARTKRADEAAKAAAARAEADKQAQAARSARTAPLQPYVAPTQSTPVSAPANRGGGVAFVAGVAAVGAILASLFGGGGSARWDANVQRYRGPDGRFC